MMASRGGIAALIASLALGAGAGAAVGGCGEDRDGGSVDVEGGTTGTVSTTSTTGETTPETTSTTETTP